MGLSVSNTVEHSKKELPLRIFGFRNKIEEK